MRIEQTLSDLQNARACLEGDAVQTQFRERIGSDFWQQLDRRKSDLNELYTDLRAAHANGFQNESPIRTYWGSFEANRDQTENLIRECLALVQGAIARDKRVDADLCQIADALLDELEQKAEFGWKRFTLPSDGESFSHLEQIIRIRFPSNEIWSVPVAVHEFGHFAARKMVLPDIDGDCSIFAAFLRQKQEEKQSKLSETEKSYYREFFADLFATYVLGPAYVCTCLEIRFNPVAAWNETSQTHPSDMRRSFLITAMLKRMAKVQQRDFTDVPGTVNQRWLDSLNDAGNPYYPPPDSKDLDRLSAHFYQAFRDARPELEYRTWASAQGLAGLLPNSRQFPPGTHFTDLLNGAWLARLQGWDVGERTKQWALQMAQK